MHRSVDPYIRMAVYEKISMVNAFNYNFRQKLYVNVIGNL